MLRLTLLFSVLVYGILTQFHQNDYKIISEKFEMFPNAKYFRNFTYVNFKYNRTFHAVNISAYFKVAFGNAVKFAVQGYKFTSNEYRLFPIVFDDNICRCMTKNIFGLQNLYKCGHPPTCPMVKGYFNTCNWQPDYTQFPPHLPSGRFRLDFNFTYLDEEALIVKWCYTVTRDFINY